MSDFDLERAAATMFGSTTPTSAPAPTRTSAQPVTSEEALADKLFGATTPSASQPTAKARTGYVDRRPMSELDEQEQAQRLFGDTDPTLTHSGAVQALINASMEDHLLSPEAAGEIAAEYAAVFATHQMNASESKDVADIGASVLRNPPTPELVSTWTETAIQNLQSEYGVAGAGQALQDARDYIDSVPDARDMLDAFGLGSHPKIVAMAAARGRARRLGGKVV